jgi:hypothetical protein
MLAFSLTIAALLLYLGTASPSTPIADSYTDPVRQAKLARGMVWLQQSLVPDNSEVPAPEAPPKCSGLKDAAQFDCFRLQINQRLVQVALVKQLAGQPPDATNLPDVLAAQRWLLQYSGTPTKLASLLQQGEDAARHHLSDPFRLSGCVTWAQANTPCDPRALVTQNDFLLHADHLFNSMALYTSALRGQSPNVAKIQVAPGLDTPIVQGRHVQLSLDKEHDLAQITADCYTGDATACRTCKWCNTAPAANMYEQARARSMGILVLDAKTGAIQAAASAYTACFAQQQRGESPGPNCPLLPNTLIPHLDRLGNQGLEATAKLGSITKIIISLGLTRAGLSPAETAALPRILTNSITEELIDIVMCKAQGFDSTCAQRRLAAIASTAKSLGWNNQADVLGANQLPGLYAQRFTARLLSKPNGTSMTERPLRFTTEALQTCSRQKWRGCKGPDLVNVVAELFGTGEALGSPVGVGNALLHLAAAGNGQTHVAKAHLVLSAQNNIGQSLTVQPTLIPVLNSTQISPVMDGLSRTSTQGTARTACIAAAAALPGGLLPCVTSKPDQTRPLIRVAAKTGTPVFSADQGDKKSLTLPLWRTQCAAVRRELAALSKRNPRWFSVNNEANKCNMVPTKWFAFLLSAPGSTTWDKVVVVLVGERNWNQRTGLIDSPNDRDAPNVAAEAGLALANALYHPSLTLHESP